MRSDKASWIKRVETVVDHDHLVWRYLVLWVLRDRRVSSGKFALNITVYFTASLVGENRRVARVIEYVM